MSNSGKIGVVVMMLLLAACTTTPPSIDTSAPDSDMTYDGLYPVRDTSMDAVWARSDLDLTGYKKIILQGAGIKYRLVKERPGSRFGSSNASEFPITEANKAKLTEELRSAFVAEFAKAQNFQVVTDPGPDVAIVRGGLMDVVSFVPPERTGRYDIYLERVGEATFILEVLDSQTEAVLIRAADRRAAQQTGVILESNSVTNWSEVKRLARYWARRLRVGLDDLTANAGFGSAAG